MFLTQNELSIAFIGIDIFQKETFKALYDGKQVKWEPKAITTTEEKIVVVESDLPVESSAEVPNLVTTDSESISMPTDSSVVTAAAEVATQVVSLPEIIKAEEAPALAASAVSLVEKTQPPAPVVVTPPPMEKLESVVVVSQVKREVAPEALVLKDIPINSSEMKEGVPTTEDVLRAQQAVAKTFLNILVP